MREIQSEQDYTTALARVEALMDMERSDVEDAELVAMAEQIEAYEDRHYPMGEMRSEASRQGRPARSSKTEAVLWSHPKDSRSSGGKQEAGKLADEGKE